MSDSQQQQPPTPTPAVVQVTPAPTPAQAERVTQPLDSSVVDKRVDARIAEIEQQRQAELDRQKAEADRIAAEVEKRVQATLAQRDVAQTKAALKTEYKLTDDQLGVLTGNTPDELRASAEKLFAAQKTPPPPPAPNVPAGGTAPQAGEGQPMDPKNPVTLASYEWKR
jgi:hypothetical protein